MKGIIFYGSNFINGNEKLEEIINKYTQMKIGIVKNVYNNYGSCVEFENGDVWKVAKANDMSRGHRCNVAYVERCIDYNTYNCIVRPCVTLLPFSAINLWGNGDLHISSEPIAPF